MKDEKRGGDSEMLLVVFGVFSPFLHVLPGTLTHNLDTQVDFSRNDGPKCGGPPVRAAGARQSPRTLPARAMDLCQFLGGPAGRRSVDNVLPVQDRPNGLELLLGSRATQSQGGMALLGHGEWRGEVRGEDNIHPNTQVKFSTGGGGARYWNKSNLNITGLLEGNQSTWRREQGGQIPRITLVDAQPEWQYSQAGEPEEQDLTKRSAVKKKGIFAGANGRCSDPLKRARARGARAKVKANPKTGVAEKALSCARDVLLRHLQEGKSLKSRDGCQGGN